MPDGLEPVPPVANRSWRHLKGCALSQPSSGSKSGPAGAGSSSSNQGLACMWRAALCRSRFSIEERTSWSRALQFPSQGLAFRCGGGCAPVASRVLPQDRRAALRSYALQFPTRVCMLWRAALCRSRLLDRRGDPGAGPSNSQPGPRMHLEGCALSQPSSDEGTGAGPSSLERGFLLGWGFFVVEALGGVDTWIERIEERESAILMPLRRRRRRRRFCNVQEFLRSDLGLDCLSPSGSLRGVLCNPEARADGRIAVTPTDRPVVASDRGQGNAVVLYFGPIHPSGGLGTESVGPACSFGEPGASPGISNSKSSTPPSPAMASSRREHQSGAEKGRRPWRSTGQPRRTGVCPRGGGEPWAFVFDLHSYRLAAYRVGGAGNRAQGATVDHLGDPLG